MRLEPSDGCKTDVKSRRPSPCHTWSAAGSMARCMLVTHESERPRDVRGSLSVGNASSSGRRSLLVGVTFNYEVIIYVPSSDPLSGEWQQVHAILFRHGKKSFR